MESIAKRLKEAMVRADVSQAELTRRTGISKGAISHYLSGAYEPKQNNIYLLAKALGVDEVWLMGKDPVTPIALVNIPVYTGLSCGSGTWVDENPIDYVGVPSQMTRPNTAYFSNPAEGDSMSPGIHNGDLLIFEMSDVVDYGKIGAFSLNGDYYCKRLRQYPDGSCWLFSDNPDYEPIPITDDDDFRILGIYRMKLSKEQ